MTIVQMAKRVPEAVIQEDQALLMYFDNASLLIGSRKEPHDPTGKNTRAKEKRAMKGPLDGCDVIEYGQTRAGDTMTLEGTVQDGIVVLDKGCDIPNGTHVQVIVPEAKEQPTFSDLLEFAGCMPGLPADFAAQHDHYIHGTPKK